jgi:hypothetical protein
MDNLTMDGIRADDRILNGANIILQGMIFLLAT